MPRRSIRAKPDREKKRGNNGFVWARKDEPDAKEMPFDFRPLLRKNACIATLWHHAIEMCAKSLDKCYNVELPGRSVKATVELNRDLWHHLWYDGDFWFPCRQHILPPKPNCRRRRISMRWSWDMSQSHDRAMWAKLFPSTIQVLEGPERPDGTKESLGSLIPLSNVCCIYDIVDQELTYRFEYIVTQFKTDGAQ